MDLLLQGGTDELERGQRSEMFLLHVQLLLPVCHTAPDPRLELVDAIFVHVGCLHVEKAGDVHLVEHFPIVNENLNLER